MHYTIFFVYVMTSRTSECARSSNSLEFLLADGGWRNGTPSIILSFHVEVEYLVLLNSKGRSVRLADLTRSCVDEGGVTRLVCLKTKTKLKAELFLRRLAV